VVTALNVPHIPQTRSNTIEFITNA